MPLSRLHARGGVDAVVERAGGRREAGGREDEGAVRSADNEGEGEGIEGSHRDSQRAASERAHLAAVLLLAVMLLPWQRSGATSYRRCCLIAGCTARVAETAR